MKWLLPREHGAYGQLGAPLAAAVGVGDFGAPALALTGAAVAAFLAHEPLLLLLGQRGERARERDGKGAWGWLSGLGLVAALLFLAGGYLLPGQARLLLLVPLTLAVGVAVAVALRREKTALGEVTAALALSSWALPVAVGGGASVSAGLSCWLVFALVFASATASVRGLIAWGKNGEGRAGLLLGAVVPALSALGAVALVWAGWVPRAVPLALAPILGFGLALLWRPPRAKHLRTLGWGLVAASLLTGALLVVALR